jgi:iron complex outermembrane receptor protein
MPRLLPAPRALGLLLGALGAAPLAAQERPRADAPADSGARRLPSVVVRSAGVTPAVAGGASAVVVRPDSLPIPAPPAPSLERVLRQVPFLLLRQNSRGEAELSVRGSDSRQAAVLLDGLPLTLGWDHRSDPSLVPAAGVHSVRVVRGLSSLLQGPNVLGGVVELSVAGAPGAALPPRGVRLASGVDQTGAQSASAAAVLPAATGAGRLVARVGAGYRRRDGVALTRGVARSAARVGVDAGDPGRDDDGELRTNSHMRQVDGFAALRLDGARGSHVGLTATAYQARRGVPPELHLAEPRLWRYPDASRALAVLSAGSGPRATPLGHVSVEASAGVNAGDVEIESYETRAYAAVAGRERGDERTGTARLAARLALPGGAELRAATTGAAVRYDERLDDAPAARYAQRLTSAGAELQLPAGAATTLSGGAVYDRATNPETGGRPSVGALDAWGWRLGATTRALVPALNVHAAVSRRARFPALRELYSGALNRYEPNPGLRPERLFGGELGATVIGGPTSRIGLELQAVGFHHRLDDAVVRVTIPARQFRRVNRDELRTTGVELLAGWVAARTGGPSGLAVNGDLTLQRVRVYDRTVTEGDVLRRAEHQPEQRGSLAVTVPLPLAVSGVVAGRYVGRQYCVTPDAAAPVRLRGRGAGDAALSREFTLRGAGRSLLRALSATLALDNVGDATVYDQCGLPQPGRTLRVGIELR